MSRTGSLYEVETPNGRRARTHILMYSDCPINQSANFQWIITIIQAEQSRTKQKCAFRACADSEDPDQTA